MAFPADHIRIQKDAFSAKGCEMADYLVESGVASHPYDLRFHASESRFCIKFDDYC
jgi:hypothetical protein